MDAPEILKVTECCQPRRLQASLDAIAGTRILIVGDLVLDRYQWGRSERISREAPVPVVVAESVSTALGGAANAARVAAGLGVQVALVGARGNDDAGAEIERLCQEAGIDLGGGGLDGIRTATKTRVLAGSPGTMPQQVLRLDVEMEIDDAALAQVGADVEETLRQAAGGVLLSDYGQGEMRGAAFSAARNIPQGVPTVVDSRRGIGQARLAGACLKPNALELAEAVGRRVRSFEDFHAASRLLLEKTGAQSVLATAGREGMIWVDGKNAQALPILPTASDVTDVTGAGDAVAAITTAGLAAGLAPQDIMALATAVAAVVVSHPGTIAPSADEVLAVAATGVALEAGG
jgi:rfaE bifunctional protein kinase chain/domain